LIWSAHWSTLVVFGHRMSALLPIVTSAAMPTSVLPAPHGSTMMPERARRLPNIFASDFCWYGRSARSSSSDALLPSLPRSSGTAAAPPAPPSARKSYSAISGSGGTMCMHTRRTASTCAASISNISTRPGVKSAATGCAAA